MGNFDHIADTDIFRKYNIGLLKSIVNRLDRLIEILEGEPTEVVLDREELEEILKRSKDEELD